MYKKQMLFQKIICYLVIIGAALTFFYSLGMMTDLYDGLVQTIPDPTDLDPESPWGPYVAGARILYDMQPFNRLLTKGAIVLILLAVFLLVTNTHGRRRYYVGNYIAIALVSITGFVYSIYSFMEISSWKLTYQYTVDFEALEAFAERRGFKYYGPDHTIWFDLGLIVNIIFMVILGLLLVNMIWKIIMMSKEKKLLKGGN